MSSCDPFGAMSLARHNPLYFVRPQKSHVGLQCALQDLRFFSNKGGGRLSLSCEKGQNQMYEATPKPASQLMSPATTSTSSLLGVTVPQNSILAEAAASVVQKLARIQQQVARAEQRKVAEFAKCAERVGLLQLNLSGRQMLGALHMITRSAKDENAVAAYEAAADDFLTLRRGALDEEKHAVHISAATVGAEMKAECRSLGLRWIALPPGFHGRLSVKDAILIGELFAATVKILWQGEQKDLVESGKINETVRSLFDEPSGSLVRSEAGVSLSVPAEVAPSATAAVPVSTEERTPETLFAERPVSPATQLPPRPLHSRPSRTI